MRGRAIPDKFRAFLDLNHNLPSLEITSLTHSLSLFGIKENERKQLLIRFFFLRDHVIIRREAVRTFNNCTILLISFISDTYLFYSFLCNWIPLLTLSMESTEL